MEDGYYEQVMHNQNIPAMIKYLDKESVEKYFQQDVFIPTHWHRSLEISLIENACVDIQVHGKHHYVENDFTCINSGDVHFLQGVYINENSTSLIVLISYEFLKQYYPDIDHVQFDLSIKEDHSDLRRIYSRIKDIYLSEDAYAYLEITSCLLDLLAVLLRHYQKKVTSHHLNLQQQMKDILSYVHAHYQEPLSLQKMSQIFYMSPEHFSRQFHKYIGKTFKEYLSSYRLYKAYNDIVESQISIQDIARKHGFSNVKSLITLFHKVYQETPLQYRKKYQENDIL